MWRLSCSLAHPCVLLCLGSPSSRSEGPKHPEVHRVRLDHGIDAERWEENVNWVQLDVTRRSIEETAAAVMKLYADRQKARPAE